MGSHPFIPDDDNPLTRIMGALDPGTEQGQRAATQIAEEFARAERKRVAAITGLREVFEEETEAEAKAEAALVFANAVAQAQFRFMGDMKRAAEKFAAEVMGVPVGELRRHAERERFERDPGAFVAKMMQSREFMEYVFTGLGGDVSAIALERRQDGVVAVLAADEDGTPGEAIMFFDPNGEFLGTEVPGRFDAEPIGDAQIEGIDLSTTVEPVRDFDGGFGDA